MMFTSIQKELEKQKNYSMTENGAIGYKSAGSALVDINYKVSSLRQSEEEEIVKLFDNAFKENGEYALKWLFFARDVRQGLGERRLSWDAKEYYHFSEVVDEFCKKWVDYFKSNV